MEQKPLILEIEDAKRELAQCVNEIMHKHGLNCYVIEPYFGELYNQIRIAAQNELAQAREQIKGAE